MLFVDDKVQFGSFVGPVETLLSDIAWIRSVGRGEWEVGSVYGDRWYSDLDGFSFPDSPKKWGVRSRKAVSLNDLKEWRNADREMMPGGSPRLTLKDGSRILIQTPHLYFSPADTNNAAMLSAFACHAVTFEATEKGAVRSATAHFANAGKLSFRVKYGKDKLTVMDGFGVKRDILFGDIRLLEGYVPLRNAARRALLSRTNAPASDDAGPEQAASVVVVKHGNSTSLRSFDAGSVPLDVASTTMYLPQPLLQEVKVDEGLERVRVTTVYGDLLTCPAWPGLRAWMAGDLTASSGKGAHSALIAFQNLPVSIHGHTLKCFTIDGQVYVLISPDSSLQFLCLDGSRKGEVIDVSEIREAIPQKGSIQAKGLNGESLSLRPQESALEAVHPASGRRLSIRWDDIILVSSSSIPQQESQETVVTLDDKDDSPVGGGSSGQTGGDAKPLLRPGLEVIVVVTASGKTEVKDLKKRISTDGTLSLPLVGTVNAADKTTMELSRELEELYKEYFHSPRVDVDFTSDRAGDAVSPWGYVSVLGQVRQPGRISIPPTMDLSVSMAIQLAGGPGASPKLSDVKVSRRMDSGKMKTFTINLELVGSDGVMEEDLRLKPGDVVYVPERLF
jgi:protein involved in polysaccharide export with SLBB domain